MRYQCKEVLDDVLVDDTLYRGCLTCIHSSVDTGLVVMSSILIGHSLVYLLRRSEFLVSVGLVCLVLVVYFLMSSLLGPVAWVRKLGV